MRPTKAAPQTSRRSAKVALPSHESKPVVHPRPPASRADRSDAFFQGKFPFDRRIGYLTHRGAPFASRGTNRAISDCVAHHGDHNLTRPHDITNLFSHTTIQFSSVHN